MADLPLQYADLQLDRQDQWRGDSQKLQQLWQDDSTLFCLINQQQSLVISESDTGNRTEALKLSRETLQNNLSENLPTADYVFLGTQASGEAIFALCISDEIAATVLAINPLHQFIDLRKIGRLLDKPSASLLAYARGVLYWQQQNPFCNRCGSARVLTQGGHSLRCKNIDCQHLLFPRIEPAVIMLIESKNEHGEPICLLGRSANWPEGTYSTLAGFVEIGESLEDAVRREAFEEAGVHIGKVDYIAAQPWPFPSSIMLGFRAQATSTELNIDPKEIEDAQWFTLEQLLQFGTWGDETHNGYKMPRTDSIARHLLDLWIAELQSKSS